MGRALLLPPLTNPYNSCFTVAFPQAAAVDERRVLLGANSCQVGGPGLEIEQPVGGVRVEERRPPVLALVSSVLEPFLPSASRGRVLRCPSPPTGKAIAQREIPAWSHSSFGLQISKALRAASA